MASSSAVIVLVQLILTPILARIYSPSAYGTFSVYNALVQNLSVAGSLGLINALMLPNNKRELLNLLRLCFVSIAIICLLATIILLIFDHWVVGLLNIGDIGNLLYIIPLVALLHSYTQVLASWHIKSEDFKTGPKIRIANNLISRLSSITYGFLVSQNWIGLVSGDIIAKIISITQFSRKNFNRHLKILFRHISISKSVLLLSKFKEFPLYTFPAQWMGIWSGQIPIYMTAVCFSKDYVGLFSFAVSLISLPISLIGNSVHTVFYQRIAKIGKHNIHEIRKLTVKVLDKLILLGVLPFSLIIVFGDSIFTFFLGNQWSGSGKIAGYLGLYYFLFLIYSSISSIFSVLKAQKKTLFIQVAMMVVGLLSFTVGCQRQDVYLSFLLYGIFSTVIYFVAILVLLKTLHLAWFNAFFIKLLILPIVIAGLYLIKIMI